MSRKPRSERERKEFLGSICHNELARAEGGESHPLAANRQEAINYYNLVPRGDEVDGRSQVISSDLNDMVNATLAMLVPMLSTDCMVEFEPDGDEDEQAAKMESDAVHQVVIEDNRGFIEIQEAVKDALLLRNGCMAVDMKTEEQVQELSLEGGEPEQINAILAQLDEQGIEYERDGDDLKITRTSQRVLVQAEPIENISYTTGYSGRLQNIRFFACQRNYTRSDLVEMGISRSEAEDLPSRSQAITGTEIARNRGASEDGYDAETRDMDRIECHHCYVRTDMDNDGISERYHVLVADRRIALMYELHDLIPYALGSPFLSPHRLTGESLHDHLKQTQDTKTALYRQLLDNTYLVNNGRPVYNPALVNEQDIRQPRTVGGIRAKDPNAVQWQPIPDVTSGILAALDYEDARRSERGGASLDLLSADAQLVGETAHGIERQYASREALASMMGLNLAESMIREIYLLTHEYLRRYADDPITVRINGQSVPTQPRQWRQRNRVSIKVGMTPGERGHMQQTLAMHVQGQMAMMQTAPNILANAETIYRTTVDWLRMAGVDQPERLMVDPSSPQAQQAMQQQQQAAQQQQAQQIKMVDRQLNIEEKKVAVDQRHKDASIQHDYYATDAQIAMKEADIAGTAQIEVTKQRMSNEQARQREAQGGAAASGGGA